MTICAIYARVSDQSQLKGESIEHQIAFCQEVARRRSAELAQLWSTPETLIYVDRAVTGTSLLKRTAVLQLIKDARLGRFDVVLFKGISRFARDTVDALLMLRTLLSCRIRVLSMEENFDSQRDHAEFVFTIHSAMAQAESEKTSVRVRMGALQKARQGKWNGPAPDGYVLNGRTKRLDIDKSYAPVIQQVFQLYTVGEYGTRKIAECLNSQGIRTKRGSMFTQRGITRILSNPVYRGDVAYGQREQRYTAPVEEDWLVRRKVTVKIAQAEAAICCLNAHPALVTREVYARATELMARRTTNPGRNGQVHLFSRGLLRCRCLANMTVKYNARGTRYYRCIAQVNRGKSVCSQPFLRADEVEQVLLSRIFADVIEGLPFQEKTTAIVYSQLRPFFGMNTPDLHVTRCLLKHCVEHISVDGKDLQIFYSVRPILTQDSVPVVE